MHHEHVRKPVSPGDFRALFQALVGVAVASSGELAAGCGAATALEPRESPPTVDENPVGSKPSQDAAQPTDAASTGDAARHWDAAVPTDAAMPADALRDPTPRGAVVMLPGPWVPLLCSEGETWPLSQESLAARVDYLAVFSPVSSPENRMGGEDGAIGSARLGRHVLYGEACAGASEPAACLKAIDQQLAATECAAEPCAKFVLVTAGDRVTRVEGSAMAALLGVVDNETEAAIAAVVAGGVVGCWSGGNDIDGEAGSDGSRIRAVEGGYEVQTFLTCYFERSSSVTMVSPDGRVPVVGKAPFCVGRRPGGLLPEVQSDARPELGAYFASSTHLEAASVFAFEQLARDLARLGAPSELVEAALRSAREEVGHARTMGALATHFGGAHVAPRIAAPPARDTLTVALENAVEGCVRETYGALIACYQAEAARDAQVRAAMAQVAEDETRHAQLAWRIAQWLEPQLSEDDRAAVQSARRAAYAELEGALASSLSREAQRHIGLPDETVGRALLMDLDAMVGLQA